MSEVDRLDISRQKSSSCSLRKWESLAIYSTHIKHHCASVSDEIVNAIQMTVVNISESLLSKERASTGHGERMKPVIHHMIDARRLAPRVYIAPDRSIFPLHIQSIFFLNQIHLAQFPQLLTFYLRGTRLHLLPLQIRHPRTKRHPLGHTSPLHVAIQIALPNILPPHPHNITPPHTPSLKPHLKRRRLNRNRANQILRIRQPTRHGQNIEAPEESRHSKK